MTEATAVLDTFSTEGGAVTEVRFTVSGGASHNARRDAALDALEAFTERSARPVPIMHYEVTADVWPFVEFRFFAELVGTLQ